MRKLVAVLFLMALSVGVVAQPPVRELPVRNVIHAKAGKRFELPEEYFARLLAPPTANGRAVIALDGPAVVTSKCVVRATEDVGPKGGKESYEFEVQGTGRGLVTATVTSFSSDGEPTSTIYQFMSEGGVPSKTEPRKTEEKK